MKSRMDAAVAAALASGRFLKRRLGKATKVYYKGGIDLVTEMDQRSEEMIIAAIKGDFPQDGFIAEEGDRQEGSSGYQWIIDPLDGTTNYAHGYPCFTVSIALEKEGEIILGVVYNPILNELFRGEKGKGAFRNNRRITVSSTGELAKSLLATGFPYDVQEDPVNNLRHFSGFLLKAQAIRRAGSAALDLCYVAAGIFDGFWELKLNPWDVAAGSLLLTEAGGMVTDFKGGPWDHYSKEILASNGAIHAQMVSVLNCSA